MSDNVWDTPATDETQWVINVTWLNSLHERMTLILTRRTWHRRKRLSK